MSLFPYEKISGLSDSLVNFNVFASFDISIKFKHYTSIKQHIIILQNIEKKNKH